MILKRLLLYINTVRHLSFKQFIFNFIRRLFNRIQIIDVTDVECNQLSLITPVKYVNKIDNKSVCFLNVRRSVESISDWACLDETRLWRYNLHYFDYLLDQGASEEIKDKLINDWIKISLSLKQDAWEPYPISLRIVNWVKYFICYKKNNIPHHWLESLYQQSQVLFNSIEYHILANHYLKNAKALFFTGSYLRCDDAQKWFDKSRVILLEEAAEQIFCDGGHYEKSPMYHSIVTEDYLDILNLIYSQTLNISDAQISYLHDKTLSAVAFLQKIVMPDGEIPLFNDSAFNIAPHPDLIFNYAKRVLAYKPDETLHDQTISSLTDSGYFIIRDGQDMCVIDCGAISPDYQPGHTHCDMLSYELSLEGQRLVVNSGLYDYESSEERLYCRSTKAHNTVEIDAKEQSEIWSQFRVARRAKVHSASLKQTNNGASVFMGSYSPYWSANHNITHSRVVKYHNKQWTISDTVAGDGDHVVINYIHLHPGIDCMGEAGNYFLVKDDIKLASLHVSDTVDIQLEDGWYYPEFGIKEKNRLIKLTYSGDLPVKQEYKIEAI